MVAPAAVRAAVAHVLREHDVSERRACSIVGADRSTIRYRSRRSDDALLRGRLRELATERRRFGYRRLHVLLRQEGYVVNHKRTQRLYREEGLSVRRRRCRKRAVGTRAPIVVEARPNARWSLDFVHNQMASGQRFRVLNVIDYVTKRVPRGHPRHVDLSQPGRPRTGDARRQVREAEVHRQRQRNRVHLECHPAVGEADRCRVALHRAGAPHAERHLRGIQRPDAGRTPQ